jgi:hypothetical protein
VGETVALGRVQVSEKVKDKVLEEKARKFIRSSNHPTKGPDKHMAKQPKFTYTVSYTITSGSELKAKAIKSAVEGEMTFVLEELADESGSGTSPKAGKITVS